MKVELLVAAYDSGRENQRMGAGPTALRDVAVNALTLPGGPPVQVRSCHPDGAWRAELATGFALQGVVHDHALTAYTQGHTPVLLSGNCNTMLGVVAAAQAHAGPVSVVWFDAHGDANLPEHDSAGFLDGHALSMLTGHAWQAATAQLPGLRPVPGFRVLHVGGRDFNPGEHERLRSWGVRLVAPTHVDDYPWGRCMDRGGRVHIHIDLDVLDPDLVGPANSYAAPHGLTTDQLCAVLSALVEHASITSVSFASYDPDCDPDGAVSRAAHQLLRTLAPGLHR